MAQKIGSLVAQLGMDTARFDSGIKGAGKRVTSFKKRSVAAFNRINRSVSGVAGKLTGLIGIGAFVAVTRDALNTADTMEKLNKRIGVSTEALSELKFVGEQSGIEFTSLAKHMKNMANVIGEASTGMGLGQAALLELGLSAEKLNNLKPEDQLEVLADAFEGVTNSTDRTRLAMDLFGGRGVEMLQMMEGGSGSIRALRDEASNLGLTLDHDTAVGAANANDAINRATSAFRGMTLETAANLAPAIETIAAGLSEMLPKAGEMAVESFHAVRSEGLKMLSFVVQGIGKLQFALAEAYESLGLSMMEAEADRLFASAAFSANFAKNLLTSADEAAKVAAGSVGELNVKVNEISPVAVEDVASAYGKLTAKQALAALKTEKVNQKIGSSFKVDIGDSAEDVFGQISNHFKGMLKNMVNEWINSGITKLFGGGKGGGGLGGIISGLFGGGKAAGGPVQSGTSYLVGEKGPELFTPGRPGNITPNFKLFGGGKAAGGPVQSGTSYLVGEKGPELFTAGRPGNITPNGGRGGGVTIIQHNDFSGRGAMDIAETQAMLETNNKLLEANIFEKLRRKQV
jgi:hypothetical protein